VLKKFKKKKKKKKKERERERGNMGGKTLFGDPEFKILLVNLLDAS